MKIKKCFHSSFFIQKGTIMKLLLIKIYFALVKIYGIKQADKIFDELLKIIDS